MLTDFDVQQAFTGNVYRGRAGESFLKEAWTDKSDIDSRQWIERHIPKYCSSQFNYGPSHAGYVKPSLLPPLDLDGYPEPERPNQNTLLRSNSFSSFTRREKPVLNKSKSTHRHKRRKRRPKDGIDRTAIPNDTLRNDDVRNTVRFLTPAQYSEHSAHQHRNFNIPERSTTLPPLATARLSSAQLVPTRIAQFPSHPHLPSQFSNHNRHPVHRNRIVSLTKDLGLYHYWQMNPRFSMSCVEDFVTQFLLDEFIPELLIDLLEGQLLTDESLVEQLIDEVVLEECQDVIFSVSGKSKAGQKQRPDKKATDRTNRNKPELEGTPVPRLGEAEKINPLWYAIEKEVIEPVIQVQLRHVISTSIKELANEYIDFSEQYQIWDGVFRDFLADQAQTIFEEIQSELLEEELVQSIVNESILYSAVETSVQVLESTWQRVKERESQVVQEAAQRRVLDGLMCEALSQIVSQGGALYSQDHLMDHHLDSMISTKLLEEYLRLGEKNSQFGECYPISKFKTNLVVTSVFDNLVKSLKKSIANDKLLVDEYEAEQGE